MEINRIDSAKKLAKYIQNNKIVIMKISATWCGPCKNKVFLESYNNLKKKFNKKNIKFIEIDLDNDSELIENKDFYDIEIKSVPTFLISKDSSFTRKFMGINNLELIDEYISHSISKSNEYEIESN